MILVDAGPLIALVKKDDQHHKACVAALREGIRRFFTTDREDFAIYRLNGKIQPVAVP